jgi:hypothetical protein
MVDKAEDVIKRHTEERDAVIAECGNVRAVRELVHCLFPTTARADEEFTSDRVVFTEGHLGHPDRLSVALQLSAGLGDVSLVRVRHFLFHPAERDAIAASLDEDSCAPFLDCLGSVVESLGEDVMLDAEPLAIALARLIEGPPFVSRAMNRNEVWLTSAEQLALSAIGAVGRRVTPEVAAAIAEKLICDAEALSIAIGVAFASYVENEKDEGSDDPVRASPESKVRTTADLGKNLERAAAEGDFFKKVSPGRTLWFAPLLVPARCEALFRAIQQRDASLDSFALGLMEGGFDSVKGRYYAVPKEVERVEKYIAMDKLKRHAAERLKDETLGYPARAAWRAVVEGKAIYGKDGSIATRH